MADVVICGPNLNNQAKGQFHVHTADCADLDKMKRREPAYRPENRMALVADSRQEIVEWLYDDHMNEEARERGSEPDWREYDDIYLFPCLKDLPDMADDAEEDEDLEEDEDQDEEDVDDATEDDTEVDDDDAEEDQEEDDDVPDPFAEIIELAKKHGASDGSAIATEALTGEALLGYLDDNLDDEAYGEMSSYDLDRVVKNYVASLITGFGDQCRMFIKEFLEDGLGAHYLENE